MDAIKKQVNFDYNAILNDLLNYRIDYRIDYDHNAILNAILDYKYHGLLKFMDVECECGKDKHGFIGHSDWCPKDNYDKR